uniref:WGS project CAEQ00000000 data, annotated contig 899 n=1 Tax=Trypanosoma congolense (strain IL3000) TaxID=1068625 RepID=F9WJE0_TRYCI|nr:unnamed protein product [Trypanosoma congolense IL3000]
MIDPFRASINSNAAYNGGVEHSQNLQQSVHALHTGSLSSLASSVGISHNDNIEDNTTLHVTVTEDIDSFDEKQVEKLRRTLQLLEGISQGCHLINWKEIVDAKKPAESAQHISSMLAKPTILPSAVESIAKCITTPEHLSIVAKLDPPFRVQVRDAVLRDLLNTLTTERDPSPMPVCSEMLAEMVQLNLVVLRGVSRTLETLLVDSTTRRAAIAVLGKLAERSRGDAVFARAVQCLEPLLRNIEEPEYEYDRIAIGRLLNWNGMGNEVSLVRERVISHVPYHCQVTSMAYVSGRDELASAACDGSVFIWGAQNAASKDVRPATSIDLPQNYLPVALDCPPSGDYMVIAGMPISALSQQVMIKATSGSGANGQVDKKRPAPPGRVKGPLLRFLTLNEDTGVWTSGETAVRRDNTTLTAATALANMVVCAAESCPADRASESGLQHSLVLLNACTPQPSLVFDRAHEDYITTLCVGDEGGNTIFSGSRDRVVKMWDIRGNSTCPVLSIGSIAGPYAEPPLRCVESAHNDTITAILPYRKELFTASIDGTLLMWDLRRLSGAVQEIRMAAPILDLAIAGCSCLVVSTVRSLNLLSLETLKLRDVVPNVTYTKLCTNYDGRVLFAAGSTGISVYGLRI